MTSLLRHRGPDGRGHCSRGMFHVGATRLSVIDPGAGAQPIYDEARRSCVVFNGEIYNHRELRADLERKGHTFRTSTDTEVIVHLYEEAGEDCVRYLHGMFAFAILDGERLFLARDRLGIKPLHYAFVPGTQIFIFASEIKVILRHPAFTPRLNMQAFADFLVLRHPTGADTFFEGVRSLLPGHTMTVSCDDEIRIDGPKPYFVRGVTRDDAVGFSDAQAMLAASLERAVETHLAADVDVGLTLSGGLDSTVLAFLAREKVDRPLLTFTVGDHERHPDVVHAQLVAESIGSTHRTVLMTFEDYLGAIPDVIATEEKPSTLFGLPYYLLCAEIAKHVKACLHGEGADELFGGYHEYLQQDGRTSYIAKRLPLLNRLGIMPSDRALATIKRLASAPTFDHYLQCIFEVNLGDTLERHHLDPVDRSAMAASLEMRVPYLDDGVFELVSRLPLRFLVRRDLGVGKYILKRFALQRFGEPLVDIVLRQKLGFPTAGLHMLDRFDRLCDESLPDDYLAQHELGYCFTAKRELLLFEMFLEIFMEHRGDAAAVGSVGDFLRTRAGGRPRATPSAKASFR